MVQINSARSFVEFNKEDVGGAISDRFERIARKHAGRIAIKTGKSTVTYDELNRRANQIARAILAMRGPKAEPVAVLMEPEITLFAAILGVLKSGKFYVPLDPLYPVSRNSYILQDSQTSILMTDNARLPLAESLAKEGVELINVDEEGHCAPDEDPRVAVSADALAYIIYTSGSTGEPKGVVHNHRNILHKVMEYSNSWRVCPDDRLALLYSPSTSGAVRDIFGALLNGAGLYPFKIKEEGVGLLARWLIDNRITIYNSAASVFRQFGAGLTGQEKFSHLRLIHVGSETIYKRDVQAYKKYFSDDCIFIARYGTSEISPIRQFVIDKKIELVGDSVPVGYEVSGAEVLLIGDDGVEVDAGDVGEIAVRSPYATLGYWQNPALTKAAFVAGPKGENDRIYKTGDMGLLRPDGCLLHLGRKDLQVKVRGHRVEVAEIEVALLNLDGVEEAAVTARENQPGDWRLVAYVVASTEPPPAIGNLRLALMKALPDYMVPSNFVFLDSLPHTPNGKVDRKALPALDLSSSESDESFVAPRTSIEELLSNIWAETLKLERVGVHDSFFELGAHSLLGMQVLARISQTLQVELPLRALFEGPTVAELATRIEEARSEDQRLSAPPIVPVSRDRHLPVSFSQERLWFLDQYEPNSSVYNLSNALRLRGLLNLEVLERSLNEIVRRHEILRTTFSMVDGEPVQLIAPSVGLSMAVVDLSDHPEGEREEEAQRLVDEEAQRPFDLAPGPLFRAKLLLLSEDDYVLLLTMHHIVSDGWSAGVLYRELSILYRAFLNRQPSPLPELPIQYADFAVWQRERLQGEVLDRQLSYWKKQLEGMPTVLNLPTDHPRSAVQSSRAARRSVELSKELTNELKALSRKEGVTLFMTLLASFQALLYWYTGQEDIVVGSPTANRNRPEIEGLIGFFVNTLVLRSDLSGNPSFRELLKRVREVSLGAYAHQDLPFQKLLEALNPKRNAGRRSLVQVFFAFQSVPRQPIKIPGLIVTPVRSDVGIAKAALTLYMWETQECLAGSLNYSADLFNAGTIGGMTDHFHALLNAVVADPERRLLDMPPSFEQSRAELLEAIHWATEQSSHFENDATAGREQGDL